MHDLVVIGAGPAGIAASIYAKRYNLEVLIIEKEYLFGGKVLYPHWIENFIGIPEGISGAGLSEKLKLHAEFFKIPFKTAQVVGLTRHDDYFSLLLSNGDLLQSKIVVLANGTVERSLGIPGEIEYKGKGVSYCATCDAPFFKNKTIAVVGGGDSALAETSYLSEFAFKLLLIHRKTNFRGSDHLIKKLLENPQVEPHMGCIINEIKGDGTQVRSILIENLDSQIKTELMIDGLFIFAGYEPDTSFVEANVDKDKKGYLITNEDMETNVHGLFAAGDIRSKNFRQIITALSDGAIAAHAIRSMLKY